jgi:RNA 3'-terminal phosphate cyclase (ATP)
MLALDGSQGEGGGQILRSALALSLVTGTPFRIDNIRAGRPRPGLMRQHLTAVEAAAAVGGAQTTGAAVGSRSVTFEPAGVRAGDYAFSVGTAGSATLVLQTVLPCLLIANRPSSLVLEGGTHNPSSPPFDFLAKSFLPLVGRMGARVEATLERPGFYPAGGGRFRVTVAPTKALTPLVLEQRGAIQARRVRAVVANLPRAVGERELDRFAARTHWDTSASSLEVVPNPIGPGNVLIAEVESEHVTEVFTGFGEKQVRAETVADVCCRAMTAHHIRVVSSRLTLAARKSLSSPPGRSPASSRRAPPFRPVGDRWTRRHACQSGRQALPKLRCSAWCALRSLSTPAAGVGRRSR